MNKKHLLILTICLFAFSKSIIGQTKNATDFLNFSKQNFTAKSSQLKSNGWKLLQPTSTEIDNGIKTKLSFYGKEISSKEYYIILEFMSGNQTTTEIQKTSIKLPNGTEFDKWVAEFENMGYKFQKVSGQKGHLFSGEKGMIIKVGINNLEYAESEWSYEISIMIDNK